jgi:hypothetical protein
MSNYPPGVTGREYAIAGADWEKEMSVTTHCTNKDCEWHNEDQDLDNVLVEAYAGQLYFTWTCEACKTEHETEQAWSDYHDYD